MKKIIATFFAIVAFAAAHAQQVKKETFLYSVKGTDSLRLDKYDAVEVEGLKPCVIFVHGGHFKFGKRENGRSYYEYLARNGFTTVSISYRLGFKGINPDTHKLGDIETIYGLFAKTIDMAVEDLFDATSFVLARAGEWGVDPEQIIANGSSAGAVTVLQGQYYISNGHELVGKLPEGFNYAGVSAFAGAILSRESELTWAGKPCPIQMFHGDADDKVPYDALRVPIGGLYGSKYIAGTLREKQSPYWFTTVVDTGHGVAESPMIETPNKVVDFMKILALWKNPQMVDEQVRIVGRPERKKDFVLEDFIRSTFGG